VPVLLAGLEEDPVAGAYHFNLTVPPLTAADPKAITPPLPGGAT
jgi:hypothetical protein